MVLDRIDSSACKGKVIDLYVDKLLLTVAVGIGGELLHIVDYPEPAFTCGASRICAHGRVHGLPAVGRPKEYAGDAAHDLGGGRG
jgi:hypothetical protein